MSIDYANDILPLFTPVKHSNLHKPLYDYAKYLFVLPDNLKQDPIDPSFDKKIKNDIDKTQKARVYDKYVNVRDKSQLDLKNLEARMREVNRNYTLFYCFIIMKATGKKMEGRNDKKVSYRLRIYDHTLTPIDLKINLADDDFIIKSDAIQKLKSFLKLKLDIIEFKSDIINSDIINTPWYDFNTLTKVSVLLQRLEMHPELNHKNLVPIENKKVNQNAGGYRRKKKQTRRNKNKKQTRKH